MSTKKQLKKSCKSRETRPKGAKKKSTETKVASAKKKEPPSTTSDPAGISKIQFENMLHNARCEVFEPRSPDQIDWPDAALTAVLDDLERCAAEEKWLEPRDIGRAAGRSAIEKRPLAKLVSYWAVSRTSTPALGKRDWRRWVYTHHIRPEEWLPILEACLDGYPLCNMQYGARNVCCNIAPLISQQKWRDSFGFLNPWSPRCNTAPRNGCRALVCGHIMFLVPA